MKNIVLGVLLFFISALVFAEGVDASAPSFSVHPILPDNQEDDITGYISVKPNGDFDQNVEFSLRNPGNKEVEVEITPLNSYSSPNMIIDYRTEDGEMSEIINKEYEFSRYVNMEESIVKIPANSEKTVSIPVKIDKMDGHVLGAFGFSQVDKEEDKDSDGQINIKNKVSITIGVAVKFNDTDMVVSFGDSSLTALSSYYIVNLPINLESNSLVSDAEIRYESIDQNGDLMFEGKETLKMAPSSRTILSIPFEHNEIEKGVDYTIKGEVEHKGNKSKFESKYQFISEEENGRETLKTLDKPSIKGNSSGVIVGAIIISLLAIISIIFVMYKNKKKQ